MSKKITSLFNFKKLQKFSSALMLPIAILPAAGLILAIGISFNIELLANCGGLIFANLPLLFCVGIVIGLTGDGSSSLSAIISYMIMNATMGTQLGITAESVAASNGDYAMILGVPTLQTGVFGGLIVAIFVSVSWFLRWKTLCTDYYGCGGNYCRLFIAVAVDTGTKRSGVAFNAGDQWT